MANSIAAITQYLTGIIEQTYRKASLTQFLDTQGVIKDAFSNAKIVNIPKIELEGLADYSRTAGYTSGDATLSFVPYELKKDRGRKFNIDSVDNMDAAGLAVAQLASTFERDYVVPELDAYRFSQYAAGADSSMVKALALTKSNILSTLDDAQAALSDAEVPEENRILFLTPAVYALLKQAIDGSRIHTGTLVNRNVTMIDDLPVIQVPSGRFYDAITLKEGGYEARKADTSVTPNVAAAVGLNFILMDRNAPLQIVKHNPARLFSPSENQDADAWSYTYRMFHDATIKSNKAKGVYVCKKTS